MTKPITLQQWASILPYGMKVTCADTKMVQLLWGISGKDTIEVVQIDDNEKCRLISTHKEDESNEYAIPHLRPLSCLTKEITVENFNDGKPFVPIEEFEIGDEDGYAFEADFGNVKLIKSLEALAEHQIQHDVNYLPKFVIDQLLSWHFAVGFEEGQYIPIED